MTAPTAARERTHARRRPRDRIGMAVVVICTVLGLWLGLTGPSVSPVAPPASSVPVAPLVQVAP